MWISSYFYPSQLYVLSARSSAEILRSVLLQKLNSDKLTEHLTGLNQQRLNGRNGKTSSLYLVLLSVLNLSARRLFIFSVLFNVIIIHVQS